MADYQPSSPTSSLALSQPCDDGDDDDDDQTTAIRRTKISGEARRSISTSTPKPRGRPRGSKNKPKPPLVITRDSETSMQPLILELAAGSDILHCVAAFARRRRIGVSILAGSGAVSTLALRQPATPSASFTVSGRFDIVSLCGTFPPPPPPPAAAEASPEFTISVAVARGEVIGGVVAGPVTAAGTVVVVGASFLAAEFQRLPAVVEREGEEAATAAPAGIPATGQVSHDMVLWATPASSRSFSGDHYRRSQY